MKHSLLVPIAVLALTAAPALAQEPAPSCADSVDFPVDPLGSAARDFARLAEINGQAPLRSQLIRRPSSARTTRVCAGTPWSALADEASAPTGPAVELLPIRGYGILNSGYPSDRNNGALWSGRGISTAATAGVAARWGPVSAAFHPSLLYQQNRDYIHTPYAEGGIDMPQQIGNTAFSLVDPGQSYVRVDAYGLAAGLSTENTWLGPGTHSSILMTNTGPGFPHGFLGTSRPIDIWIGGLESQLMVGNLSESWFFDERPENDDRLFTSLTLSFTPRGLPGLYLGAARVFQQYVPESGLELRNYLPFLEGPLAGGLDDAGRDELFSFFARWALPESGFEAYFEWGRNDRNVDFHGMIAEPDHTRAYVIGFQKVVETTPGWLRLFGEVVNLENSLTRLHRTSGSYYTHSPISQGYTHRGQLLGAWTGPGSSSQIVGGDLFARWGSVGLFAERVRRREDDYYDLWRRWPEYPVRHDVELTLGTRGLVFYRDLEIGGGVAYSQRRNRGFIVPRETDPGYRVDGNWTLELSVGWRPEMGIALPLP